MAMQKMVVNVPEGGLFYGNGYVYINIESVYDPEVKYTRSKRLCIGKNIDNKTMYANSNYIAMFAKDSLPDPPERSDTLAIGVPLLLKKAACDSGLDSSLLSVFNPDETNLILDLAVYLLTEETDAFQHYPSYGFHNALLSESIVSDSTISRFLKENIKPSAIQQFLDEWSEQNAGKGRAYLCYDSTNINCVTDGVTLAETGHAKDDPSKPQVNLEYVVRQEDGLPLIYKDYKRNNKAIDEAIELEGFHILVSSDEMTCSEAVEAYSKRDCVEKTFKALKTNTGMDTLRGHSNANIDGRFFIMFIASILRSIVFHSSKGLRDKDRKNYTFSAIVKELNKIEAVVNYKTGQYNRRYKLTAKQKAMLSCLALSEIDVDEFAKSISSSYKS